MAQNQQFRSTANIFLPLKVEYNCIHRSFKELQRRPNRYKIKILKGPLRKECKELSANISRTYNMFQGMNITDPYRYI